MEGHLNPKVIHERAREMIALSKKLKKNYNEQFLNKEVDVLFETIKNGYYVGHSSNYLEVLVKSDIDLTNQILKVKITKINEENMKGELV